MYQFCICFNTFLYEIAVCLCVCVIGGVSSLLDCEPAACASAFLVCFLRVCFVYGLCIVPVCFQCAFVNLLRAFLHLSCVCFVCVSRRVCVSFLYISNTFLPCACCVFFSAFGVCVCVCFADGPCVVFAYSP